MHDSSPGRVDKLGEHHVPAGGGGVVPDGGSLLEQAKPLAGGVADASPGPSSPKPPIEPVSLNQSTFRTLGSHVEIPTYNREQLQVGHVHFGPGNFFKSLIAPISDRFMHQGSAGWAEWGICAVSLQNDCSGLKQQNGLYTLVTRSCSEERFRVIGSIKEALYGPKEGEAVFNRLCDPRVRLVTLTITPNAYGLAWGNGYAEDGELDLSNTGVKHDLENPRNPITATGFIVEALRRRKDAGIAPFVTVSCDNFPPNGDRTRASILQFAAQIDKDLYLWIRENCRFPNTMVDRITPKLKHADFEYVRDNAGIVDLVPTITEGYYQFVVQDRNQGGRSTFVNGSPPWQSSGNVHMTHEVDPFAKMKLRLVNGGHVAIAWLGSRMGAQTVDGFLSDPQAAMFVHSMMSDEIAPTLQPVPGVSFDSYINQTMQRFANHRLPDAINRLNNNASQKIADRILVSVRDCVERGVEVDKLAVVVGAWILSSIGDGLSEKGQKIEAVDHFEMTKRYSAAKHWSDLLLISEIFGDDLPRNGKFVEAVTRAVNLMQQFPLREVIEKYNSGEFKNYD